MLTHNHPAADYRIEINGIDITPAISARLISLQIVDNAGQNADTITITLTDHDGKLALPPRNALAQVFIGFAGQPLVDKGTYTIDEVEYSGPPDTITISGKSASMSGTLPGQKSRSHRKTTIGQLVGKIAQEHGLTASVEARLSGIRIPHLDQTAESDLNLLTRLASKHDAIATVKGQHLLFIPAASSATAGGTPLEPLKLTKQDMAIYRYQVTDRDTYTGVKASWNSRSGGRKKLVLVGDGEKAKELRQTYATEEDALTAATAELERIKRGGATLSITLAVAVPELIAETPVEISGLKADIDDQEWTCRIVTTRLDGQGGITTAIEC